MAFDPPDTTCWHEAGHAFAAHRLGGTVRSVTIESERDDHAGSTAIAWSGGLATEDRLRRSALTALAGPLAELCFLGQDVETADPEILAGWRHDSEELSRCLEQLSAAPDERETLRAQLVGEALALIDNPAAQESIARIADMLAAHETLDETLFGDAVG